MTDTELEDLRLTVMGRGEALLWIQRHEQPVPPEAERLFWASLDKLLAHSPDIAVAYAHNFIARRQP